MRRFASVLLSGSLLLPSAVSGQSLAEQFGGLFTFGDCGEPLCLPVNAGVHGSHYIPGVVQGQNNLLAFLGSSIATSLGNLPVSSATSAEIFSFVNGLPVAEQGSAGPIFGERAQTLGQGRFVLGAAVTGLSFNQIRGVNLNDVELSFVHQNVGAAEFGDPAFEQDVIEVSADMQLDIMAISMGATYGLTNRIDVGVVVPFVTAKLLGTSSARVLSALSTTPHSFGTSDNPSQTANASADGSASGVGDITGRIKVNVLQSANQGFALLGEIRLPTGDDENFLGSGETVLRGLGVFSARRGNFTPHVNAGVVVRTGDINTTGVVVNAGFDQLLSPKATLAIDLLGSVQLGEGIEFPTEAVFDVPAGQTVDLTNIPDASDHVLDLSVGGKFTASDNLRFITNIFVPLNSGGLRSSLGWTVGLELDFR